MDWSQGQDNVLLKQYFGSVALSVQFCIGQVDLWQVEAKSSDYLLGEKCLYAVSATYCYSPLSEFLSYQGHD